MLTSDIYQRHFGEEPSTDWGPEQDVNSTRVIMKALDAESPDLVIFLGDQITGENIKRNATSYLAQIFSQLNKRQVPWASVYGNHDTGIEFSRTDLLEFEVAQELSFTKKSPDNVYGATNYWLPIYGDTDESPNAILWFLDSNGNTTGASKDPSWIQRSQVEWAAQESRQIKSNFGKLISLMFFHIPIPLARDFNDDPMYFSEYCTGYRGEDDIATQPQDEGIQKLFTTIETPILATFSGHDHGTSWCCKSPELNNLNLCFSRHSGYGGYGTWERGWRVVQLSQDTSKAETWIGFENGTRTESSFFE
ncbi:hypothetical protein HDU97_000910 [Phlyctochytrium planicorne]|nr:hypothetical protein HDU97_000910 [Phlyctochytrium planicorne]